MSSSRSPRKSKEQSWANQDPASGATGIECSPTRRKTRPTRCTSSDLWWRTTISPTSILPHSEGGRRSLQGSQTVKAIAAVLAAAQAEGSQWQMKEVQVWNPNSTTLAAAQLLDPKASVTHRETSSIAALRWYGEGSWEDVDWICNEKYAWC